MPTGYTAGPSDLDSLVAAWYPAQPEAKVALRLDRDPGELVAELKFVVQPTEGSVGVGPTGAVERLASQVGGLL